MKGKKGFTLVEIMIVVAIIGLLAAIAIPSLLKARQETQRKSIVNNLRILSDARDQVLTKSNFLAMSSVDFEMVEGELDDGVAGLNWPGDFDDYQLVGVTDTPEFGTADEADKDVWIIQIPLAVIVDLGSDDETIEFQR